LRNITKLKRSIRAISPVISVLLMIAIAVVASLVAYAWVMGYMNFQTAKVGNAIQLPSAASQGGFLTVYVQNIGQGPVTLSRTSSVYVNDALVNIVESPRGSTAPAEIPVGAGQTVELLTDYPYTEGAVKIKVVTTSGTFMEKQVTGLSNNNNQNPGQTYTLTITQPEHGAITASPSQTVFNEGASVVLTATPDSGYAFSAWSGDASGTTNPLTITMDNYKTVTATFTVIPPNQYALTTEVTGMGSITRAPDQATYTSGTSVQVTATAAPGWTFDRWEGAATGSTSPATILIDAVKTVTAVFTQNEYTLTVTTTGAGTGSVAKNPNQATYHYGDVVQLTANPSGSSSFAGWSGDLTGTTNPDSVTINGNKAVTAAFAVNQHKVSFAQTGSGSTVTVSYQINGGATQTGNAPFDVPLTQGQTITYSYPSTIGTTGTRYMLNNNPGTSQTMGTSDIIVSGAYKIQYQITFDASTNVKSDSSANLLTVNGSARSLPYTTSWLDSGVDKLTYAFQSPITSTGSPATTRYLWGSTSGLSQTLQTNTFTVAGTGTITATYATQRFEVSGSQSGYANSGTTVTLTLTGCKPNDLLIVVGSARNNLVSSVSDNLGTHLAWAQRGTVNTNSYQRTSEWYAVFPAGGSITITVTFPSADTTNGLSAVAFAISGADTATPFATSSGSPYTNYGNNSAPSVTGISTNYANSMIIGLTGSRAATTQTAGTNYALIQSVTSNVGNAAAENRIVTSTQSSLTVNFGTSTSSWSMIVDAVRRAW